MIETSVQPARTIGPAAFARMVFEGRPLEPVFERLKERAQTYPDDAGARMDIATMLLMSGQLEAGLAMQAESLGMQRAYVRPARAPASLRLLAIVAAGDLMANTPLDFLLEDAAIDLISLFVAPDGRLPEVPPHDVAFLAIGESEANAPLLDALAPQLARWPGPLVNGDPQRIRALSRDRVSAGLAGSPAVYSPSVARLGRAELEGWIDGRRPPFGFPLLVRPLASHAGAGLARLDAAAEVLGYLADQPEAAFYVCPFIDYAGKDGLFRKQRIALIGGRPFVCHLAVSEHWMVHYLSAGMAERPERRAEEAALMADFDEDFAVRHADAFAALNASLRLDYAAIDCAELADGRLLLFEADTAMIVHAMDPPDLFAYKAAPMRKLFAAFEAMLRAAA